MLKIHRFFNGFWLPFWRYFGSQNDTKLWSKNRLIFWCIFASVWDQKWSQKGAPWEAKWRWKSRHFDGYSRPTPTTPPRTDFGRVLGGKSAPISGFWEPPWIQIGGKMEGFLLVWRILTNPGESSRILANPSESQRILANPSESNSKRMARDHKSIALSVPMAKQGLTRLGPLAQRILGYFWDHVGIVLGLFSGVV